jgi:hypothetical protein
MIRARVERGEVREPPKPGLRMVEFEVTLSCDGVTYVASRRLDGALMHVPICATFKRTGWCLHLGAGALRAEEPDLWAKRRLREILTSHDPVAGEGIASEKRRSLAALRVAVLAVLSEAESWAHALEGHEGRGAMTQAELAEAGFEAYCGPKETPGA